MTTLADQSTVSGIPWWVWAILATVAIVVLMRPAWRREGKRIDHVLESFSETPPMWDGATKPVETCTVPFCEAKVSVHLHVGQDWWLFCLEHGTPYLTENLRGEAS